MKLLAKVVSKFLALDKEIACAMLFSQKLPVVPETT
jgi:hypothetical protein